MSAKGQPQADKGNAQKPQAKQPDTQGLDAQVEQINLATVFQQARLNPRSLTSQNMLQLQHKIGNKAVSQILTRTPQLSGNQPVQRGSSFVVDEDTEELAIRSGLALRRLLLRLGWVSPYEVQGNRKTAAQMTSILEQLSTQRNIDRISFQNCTFPGGWGTGAFSRLANLSYLQIYSPKGPSPQDGLSGLIGLTNLKSLDLTRAEFMDANCYRDLGAMVQIEHLILDRTITEEKSPGTATMELTEDNRSIRKVTQLDPSVMNALVALLNGGSLKTLSLRWCTALSQDDKQTLQQLANNRNCQITF
jgi:hypothetical protein